MKNIVLFSILMLSLTMKIEAQDFLPFASSNYAGITGTYLQPASIADSRYKFDLALSSTGISFYNNFYGIDPYYFWHPSEFSNLDFKSQDVFRNLDGKDKTAIFSEKQDIFSFLLSLSDKDAIAFTPSVRTILNIDNMTQNLALQLDGLERETDLWGIQLKNDDLNGQLNSWIEYGFTYARVLLDKEKHFLKAGATLKVNQSIGSAYMFIKNLNYEAVGEDTISLFNSYTNYGISEGLNEDYNFHFLENPSLSFDFGAVYEYRPEWMRFKYDMDGKTNLWRKDKDKYLFRIGLTVSDLGSIRFKRDPMSKDFNADINKWYIGDLGISDLTEFNNLIDSLFTTYDVPDSYGMNLPVCLSLQADLRIANGLYVNFTPYMAFNKGTNNVDKVHYMSAFNLVPRYDKAWFGVSVPVQYNAYKQWNIGLGLRLGPVWFGWNDFFSTLASSKYRYGSTATVVLKFPVLYRQPHDKDHDQVSDNKDLCPELAGVWKLEGCPDADGDGITDAKDDCPEVIGMLEFNGCPDTDADGIMDKNDLCPDTKGLVQFSGCPDSDGDSIIDQNDLCPFNAGLLSLNGCPDQDSDGIPDKDDNCPTLSGTRENRGCPFIDSDADGINDENDKCPGMKGPIENQGCPYEDTDKDSIPDKDDDCPSIPGTVIFRGCPDTDGDGISDKYDLCPTIPGVAQSNGCPEIKKEEQEIVKAAYDRLEFATGKSVIMASSYKSLDQLAYVMMKRKEFKLALAGHTDDVGNPSSNMTLSKNRTLAVKNYLVKRGADPNRIKTEWFGQTKPIAPNTTPEGRQRNRRVEMKIIFD